VGELKRIQWATSARFDLRRLRVWTERYSGREKARVQARRIKRAAESLAENPRLGTKVEVPDGGAEELRQLVIAPYVMRYVVEIDRIVVLRVWHSRENGRDGVQLN